MWYGETVWPTLVALGTVAAVSVTIWLDRRKPALLVVPLLCIPAAIGAIILERQIVTPGEQVAARLQQLLGDFEQQNVAAVLDGVSSRSPEIQTIAEKALEKVTIQNVRLTDVNVEISGEDVLRARSHFRVTADVMLLGLPPVKRQPTRWKATWEQEADGQWRMLELDQLDPLTGEPVYQARQYLH